MTDFGSEPTLPPPPSASPWATPAPNYSPPAGPPPGQLPPGYIMGPPPYAPPPGITFYKQPMPRKPPRPPVRIGALLIILGAVLTIVGSSLTWYTISGIAVNGFHDTIDPSNGATVSNLGAMFVFFAVVALGFGITQLAAGRVLAVAIIAVVIGAFAALSTLVALDDAHRIGSYVRSSLVSFSMGAGIYVVTVGTVLSLVGAIATLSKRRTWPVPA